MVHRVVCNCFINCNQCIRLPISNGFNTKDEGHQYFPYDFLYAELDWWRKGVFADELTEDIYYNILDIRNELAVASLALRRWQAYRYNNYIYSTLYRLVDEDKAVAMQYERAREAKSLRQALIGISAFLALVLLLYLLVSYLRHTIIG